MVWNRSRRGSHLSSKVTVMKKVRSWIADYSLTFELQHFHYDLLLFKTVSGAVSVRRNWFCSPAKSLETKSFSTEYWRWQLRFLLDAVRQFGPPSAFITISPLEWSFPFLPWMENLRQLTGRAPTELPALESLNIVQVLEQVAHGYLGSTNSKAWSNQIFNFNRPPGYQNFNTLFYRFEFQQCLNTIQGDIPRSEPELSLHDPAEAFAANLRAYISTVMDIHTSDGKRHASAIRDFLRCQMSWQPNEWRTVQQSRHSLSSSEQILGNDHAFRARDGDGFDWETHCIHLS